MVAIAFERPSAEQISAGIHRQGRVFEIALEVELRYETSGLRDCQTIHRTPGKVVRDQLPMLLERAARVEPLIRPERATLPGVMGHVAATGDGVDRESLSDQHDLHLSRPFVTADDTLLELLEGGPGHRGEGLRIGLRVERLAKEGDDLRRTAALADQHVRPCQLDRGMRDRAEVGDAILPRFLAIDQATTQGHECVKV